MKSKIDIRLLLGLFLLWLPFIVQGQGITITSGGNITITGAASIEISNGNFVNYGNYTKANETVTFSGSTADTISGASNTIFNNLVITNTGGTNILAGTAVTTTNLTTTGGTFIVNSNATNSGSLIVNGTSTGDVIYKRYLSGNAWHMVSSPAPGGTISDFLSANTNVPTSGSYRGMMDYDESINTWNTFFLNSEPGNLTSGKGFSLRTDADGTVTFIGSLATGTVNTTVARTDNFGWNCVGNPYSSAIFINDAADADDNFIDLNSANLDESYASVYVWEEGSDAYSIIALGDAAFYAQPGQAFMVKANTGKTSVQFTTAMQTHQPSAAFKSGTVVSPEIRLTATMNEKERTTRIKFNDAMTTSLDVGYDAGVFKTGFDIYTKLIEDNGVDFGLQSLPLSDIESYEIPVGVNIKESGEISFSLNKENFPQDMIPVLTDNQTGEHFAFTKEGNVYTTTTSSETNGYGRFTLTFSSVTGVEDLLSTPQTYRAWYSNGQITISGETKGKATAEIYDLQGRKLAIHQLKNTNLNRIEAPQGSTGIYLLRIKDSGRTEVLKVVSTVN
ncbi:MAG: T9SS type A sorting domain-containing protein [Prolixibacteraceae bacterium]|nr:T9SS type A sorting domain-containing protein [Prolixibacteraceae bacterium]